jgi:hypothetical protein
VNFESNPETGIYFWRTGITDDIEAQHSNRPHPELPNYCKEHDWYTDKPCPAEHAA